MKASVKHALRTSPLEGKSWGLGIGLITWTFTVSSWRPCPCNERRTQTDTESKEAKQAAPGLLPLAEGGGAQAEHLNVVAWRQAAAWVVRSTGWKAPASFPTDPRALKYLLHSDATAPEILPLEDHLLRTW